MNIITEINHLPGQLSSASLKKAFGIGTKFQFAVTAALGMLMAISVNATDLYWSGEGVSEGGTGTWNSTSLTNFGTLAAGPFDTNWVGTLGDNAIFESTGGAVAFSAVTLEGAMFVKTAGYTFPSGTLTLGAGGATNDVADGVTTTITGVMGGTGSLTKNGNGVMILGAVNTYTGGTILNAGTLGWSSLTTTIGNNSPGVKIIINSNDVKFANSGTASKTPQQQVDQLADLICDDSLNVSPALINFSGAQGPWTLKNSDHKITVNGAASLQIGSVLTNDGTVRNLTKAGTGLLILGGNSSAYAGTITVQTGGILRAATSANSLGNTSGGTTVESGGTLQLNITGSAEPVTLNGSGATNGGALRASANNIAYSGPITLGSSGVRITADNSTFTISGGISGAGTDLTIGGSGASVITNSPISLSSGSVTKEGSGTCTFASTNSYAGGTTINAGKISIGNNSALSSGGITVASTGSSGQQILMSTAGLNITNALTISGNGGVSAQGIVYYNQTSGSATWSGPITINGSASTGGHFASAAGGELVLAGPITSSALLTMRNGTVTFSNLGNSFSSMSIQGGTCKLGVTNALPVGATLDMGANGTAVLDVNGFDQTLAGLTRNNTTQTANVINGGAGNPTLTINNSSAMTFAGVLGGTGNSFNLTKTGSGTFTLSTNNTYSGVTLISAGTLNISNTVGSGTSTGAVTIASSGTLAGSGSLAGTVAVNGTVAPGNSVGILSSGTETWAGEGHYVWEINSAAGTAGVNPGWDTLNILGGLDITATSGSKFNLDITSLDLANAAGAVSDFNSASNYSWSLAHTTTGITGFNPNSFALNTSGFSNNLGGGSFSITTNATDILLIFTAAIGGQQPTNFVTTAAGQGTFSGSPNTSYTVQYVNNFTLPISWQTLTNVATDNAGVGIFNDVTAPNGQPQRYYRVKNP